jgi:BASS family bile acid:Na+ symporter
MSGEYTAAVRLLTGLSIAGILLAVGMRLRWREVVDALRRSRLAWLLSLNFVVVPMVTLALAHALDVPRPITVGMLLLAAAPFAPVVPVFAGLAGADLALAAGLTALMPFLSAFLAPAVCAIGLLALPGAEALQFRFLTILLVLVATISLPLAAGVALNHGLPRLTTRILRPIEALSSATGALVLVIVAVLQVRTVVAIGWKPLLAMTLVFELSMLLGWASSASARGARKVAALGTGNRNIALALLLALASFPASPVVGAVVANGLLMIILGLVHVFWWRRG